MIESNGMIRDLDSSSLEQRAIIEYIEYDINETTAKYMSFLFASWFC